MLMKKEYMIPQTEVLEFDMNSSCLQSWSVKGDSGLNGDMPETDLPSDLFGVMGLL